MNLIEDRGSIMKLLAACDVIFIGKTGRSARLKDNPKVLYAMISAMANNVVTNLHG